jgi:AcrR family transcriptional regulator
VTDGGGVRKATRTRPAGAGTGGAGASTRHQGITRDDVIDAALALVEHGGPEALSMRKLAAELGVATTTIYWHVGNRDELVLAVVRRQAELQAASRVRGRTAEERIRSAARNIWRSARAHRNVTALANQAGATTLLALPLEVALVAELEDAGVRGRAARDALHAILGVIAGFLVMAWRRGHVPDELHPAALWAAVDDERIGGATRAALAKGPDLDRLFDATVGAVVAGVLADTGAGGGEGTEGGARR